MEAYSEIVLVSLRFQPTIADESILELMRNRDRRYSSFFTPTPLRQIPSSWPVPSDGIYHLGLKAIFELLPAPLITRLKVRLPSLLPPPAPA